MPNFDWDPKKAARNLSVHKVPFEVATWVFDDPLAIDGVDRRKDYREERSNIIGTVDNRVLFVTYTLRNEAIRIISARRANKKERKRYEEEADRR
jgi:uncharacterized protein